jgi:hypothetical protein
VFGDEHFAGDGVGGGREEGGGLDWGCIEWHGC